ncbi:MAG: hypothetical protein KJ621_07630 [Proteobacteria bacterium]|nr:hypothetical protein [Pseudomonadota bacterium]
MEGGLGRKGETFLECPFCKKGQVRVFHKEGYLQPKVSRISAGSKVTYHRVPDKYRVLEDCPKCGRTKKDIQQVFDGKYVDTARMKKRVEHLKRQGIPTRLTF